MSDMGNSPDLKRKSSLGLWFEAWLKVRRGDLTIKVELGGIAWAGFWIGLGLYLAAGVMQGQVHVPGWIQP